ncbi:site-specific integrase [Mesonia sp. K7]|uniref:site-specific integrase n=1 Tax=Mesonia sp. K7 TaxID=2218606 RepID=UPI000DA9EC6A|nr:site-specific integrase [Mesonia sp. K7]PZD76816.1 site-specific integrase [Mesonia sp. K7]
MTHFTTFSLLIWVHASRVKNDLAPIYARITVNGKRTNFSLNRKINPNYWDSSKSRAKKNTPKSEKLNRYLAQVEEQIFEAYEELKQNDAFISAQTIKARYFGDDQINKTLLDLVTYHNESMQGILKPGTLKNYKTTKLYIKQFLKAKFNIDDISLKQLSYSFVIEFEHFLKKNPNLNNNGLMKHMERLKKLCHFGYKLEWIDKNPSKSYQLRFEKTQRQMLTKEELEILTTSVLDKQTHQIARDIYVFACYTGLAYGDVYNLTNNNIVIGIDGEKWISTQREKTSTKVMVPLLDRAKSIIKKYKDYPRLEDTQKLLPVYSNQKMNKYIKEVTAILKINKHLTFHTARHTFATTVTLSNGVPIETVSKLLGHNKISTTQIYAKVIETKISEDMSILKQKLCSRKNKDIA